MAVKVYNSDIQQWEEKSAQDATVALRLPHYSIEKGTYNVVGPAGDVFSVDSSELYTYLDSPEFRLEQEEEQQRRVLQEDYGGFTGQTAALAIGAARGATLGVSDVVGGELGLKDSLQNLEQANPGVSLTGEVLGIGAISALTGGGAAAAQGGRAAQIARALPAGQAMRAGRGVEAAVAKALKNVPAWEKQAAVLGRAAGAATENAMFGTGVALSELALGDPQVTAEEVLFELASGAGVGAAVGGGLSLGASGLGKLFNSYMAKRADAKAVREVLKQHTGQDLPTKFVKDRVLPYLKEKGITGVTKLSAAVSGDASAEAAIRARFKTNAAKRALGFVSKQEAQSVRGTALKKLLDKQFASFNKAVTESIGERKVANLASKLPDTADNPVQWMEANIFMGQVEERLPVLVADGEISRGMQRKLSEMFQNTRNSINRRGQYSPEIVFDEMDILASKIKKEVKNKVPKGLMNPNPRDFRDAQALKGIHEETGQFLADGPFGEAGQARALINKASQQDIGMSKEIAKKYASKADIGDDYGDLFFADDAKLRSFLGNIHHQDTLSMDMWEKYLQAKTERLKANLRHLDLGKEERALHGKALKDLKDLRKELNFSHEQMKQISMQQQMEAISGFALVSGSILGGMAERTLTDDFTTAGPTLGMVASVLSRPGHLLRRVAQLQALKTSTAQRLSKAAKTIVQPKQTKMTQGYLKRGFTPVATYTATTRVQQKRKEYERAAKVQNTINNLSPVLTHPEESYLALQKEMGVLETEAPLVTQEIAGVRVRSAMYLLDKVRELQLLNEGDRVTASQSKLARFEKYERALRNPKGIISRIENGVAGSEDVEVLREVFPKLYQSLATQTMLALGDVKGELDPQVKAQLVHLFGPEVFELYEPAMINHLQGVHAVAGGMPNEQGVVQSGRPQTQGQRERVIGEYQTASERIANK